MSHTVSGDPPSGYIPTLDGWRAVAIVAVMVSHAQDLIVAAGWNQPWQIKMISCGRLGVDVFFAISGYLICNRLLREERAQGAISLKNFYLRRAFRILPLYLFYLMVLWALAAFAGLPVSRMELVSCLLFFRNYCTDLLPGIYTFHFWSLSVEEHFYLMWPFLLAFAGSKRSRWIVPALALLVHLWRSADAHFHLMERVLPGTAVLWRTDARLDALLWGCFAALLCFGRPMVRFPAFAPYLILAALAGIIAVGFPALPLIFALLFPLLIVSTISNPTASLSRLLELPPVRWLGRLSYSLYVWQSLFLQHAAFAPDPAWLTPLKQWPLNLAIIFALAAASHYLLEQPFIRLGRAWQNRRRATAAPTLPNAPAAEPIG